MSSHGIHDRRRSVQFAQRLPTHLEDPREQDGYASAKDEVYKIKKVSPERGRQDHRQDGYRIRARSPSRAATVGSSSTRRRSPSPPRSVGYMRFSNQNNYNNYSSGSSKSSGSGRNQQRQQKDEDLDTPWYKKNSVMTAVATIATVAAVLPVTIAAFSQDPAVIIHQDKTKVSKAAAEENKAAAEAKQKNADAALTMKTVATATTVSVSQGQKVYQSRITEPVLVVRDRAEQEWRPYGLRDWRKTEYLAPREEKRYG